MPMHSHESEQMTYVLQGALKFLIGGEEITVREGEVLHIPSWVEHQAEALDDTFELDMFSPIRQDWLTGSDGFVARAQCDVHCRPIRSSAGVDVELAAHAVDPPLQVAVLDLDAMPLRPPRRPFR